MRILAALAIVLILTGCHQDRALKPLEIMHGVHRVVLGPEYISWQDQHGFGCGNVRKMSAEVYEGEVIDWENGRTLPSDFNQEHDAERYVEQYCKTDQYRAVTSARSLR
jgi:hypothetical protein